MKNIIQIIFSGTATVLSFLFGGLDIALEVLLVVMVLDYITGLLKAWVNGTLDSRIGKKGIVKKIGYLTLVVLAVCLDHLAGETGAIRTLVIYFFVANEGISIVENWGAIGLPLPKVLINKLEQLKGDGNNETAIK